MKREVKLLNELQESNINDCFRVVKNYCKSLSKEKFVLSREIAKLDKKDFIIFEADIDKIDMSLLKNQKKRKMIMPTNKIFIEIPKWFYEDKDVIFVNNGGICILDDSLKILFENIKSVNKDRRVINAYTIWTVFYKKTGQFGIKPLSINFFDEIELTDEKMPSDSELLDSLKIGSIWKKNPEGTMLQEKIKSDLMIYVRKILLYLLIKIEKKEYTSYKKWTPLGFERKEIIYSHEVSKHKRHFWKDSGRFKIPLMKKEEWEKKGYQTDEVVFRDGELRRDVPYTIIGNFLVGKEKEVKKDNRRIKLAKGRILRQEEKIYKILREIFPTNYIKRHDRKVLKGLELDFLLRELRLGIEYDGEQHYDRNLCENVFKSDFDALKMRDRKKDRLCKKKNMTLIRIKYDEPLTKTHIKKKLKERGMI